MANRGNRWSQEKVMEALQAFALSKNYSEVSRDVGVPISSVRRWALENADLVARMREDYYGARTDNFIKEAAEFKDEFGSGVREKLLSCVSAVDKVLKKSRLTGQDVSTLIRELTRALQLIEGEPTDRHEVNIWAKIQGAMKKE